MGKGYTAVMECTNLANGSVATRTIHTGGDLLCLSGEIFIAVSASSNNGVAPNNSGGIVRYIFIFLLMLPSMLGIGY